MPIADPNGIMSLTVVGAVTSSPAMQKRVYVRVNVTKGWVMVVQSVVL